MKIIVELFETDLEIYNTHYKERGLLYSKDAEAIYYEVESPIMPIEGQRLGTKFGTVIVDWTYFNIDGESDDYFEKTRIVVTEE